MNKLFYLGAAGLALTLAGPAFAADMGMPVKAPFAQRFSWTGCYVGGHVGGAWESKNATDPVLLVQDNPNFGGPGTTVGTTTTHVGPSGAVIGGQIGCDYQFSPNFVAGIEGAASGGTMKGSTRVGLPASVPDTALVTAKTNFIPSVTARLGFAADHWLFYAKGGVAWAADKYSVTGTYAGTPFDFEGLSTRTGWTGGAGVEWAFADDWSARLEYDYYGFGTQTVTMNDTTNGLGPLSIKQSIQTVKLGVNFHVWGGQ
jgi:outer membrane immunogenic protein